MGMFTDRAGVQMRCTLSRGISGWLPHLTILMGMGCISGSLVDVL
jgi:hypothetical protein